MAYISFWNEALHVQWEKVVNIQDAEKLLMCVSIECAVYVNVNVCLTCLLLLMLTLDVTLGKFVNQLFLVIRVKVKD